MKLLATTVMIVMTLQTYSQSNMTVSNERSPVGLINSTNTTETPDDTDESIIKTDYTLPNGILLYGTKMVVVKNGVMRELTKEIVFQNGTRVTRDGFIYRKNKPKMLLNYGEYIDLSGKIIPMKHINSITN